MTVLLVSDHAEQVKRITIAIRAFYPGSRVETVYTADDSLEWTPKEPWTLILLDDALPGRSGLDLLPLLRERAPRSALILLTARHDTAAALDAVRAGADFALCKESPAFPADLPLLVREVLEKRQLRAKLDLAERYLRLMEGLADLVYELDAEGRFVSVSPGIVTLLGYDPHELVGAHYSTLLELIGPETGGHRLQERRTGSRATRHAEVRLLAKPGTPSERERRVVELATSGLYGPDQQFLGSIGVGRDITKQKQNETKLARLAGLTAPLDTMLREADRLMGKLRDLRLEEYLRLLDAQTARLRELGQDVLVTVEDAEAPRHLDRDRDAAPDRPPRAAASQAPAQEKGQTEGAAGRDTGSESRASPAAAPAVPRSEPAAGRPSGPPVPRDVAESRPPRAEERRRAPRIELELEARLSTGTSAWEGRVVNMSLYGLYMLFKGVVPTEVDQPIQLGLGGEGGILEIQGRIRALRRQGDPQHESDDYSASGVAVEFAQLGSVEERILASLLEGLRERAIIVKLTALLKPHSVEDLLVDVAQSATEGEPAADEAEEHRLAARVAVAIPVSIAVPGSTVAPLGPATTANLSINGVCVRTQTSTELLGRQVLLRLTPPAELLEGAEPRTGDLSCTLMGEVVWAAPEGPAAEAPHSRGPARFGIRFLHIKEDSRRRISALVDRFLGQPQRLERWGDQTEVVSELGECLNPRGQRIVLYHDRPRAPLPPASPAVIIAPGHGQTKQDYVTLGYHLAANGMHVFRYDHTNHVGDSEGDVRQSTLSGIRDDLLAVLAHVEQISPSSPIALVAANLTGRVALKVAGLDRAVRLLIVLAGVPDVQATIREVHQDDYVAAYAQGLPQGMTNLLGLNIDGDRWLSDAIKHGFADLHSAIRDAALVKIPVVWFYAEHDGWVRETAVKELQEALGSFLIGGHSMPAPLHRIAEPDAVEEVFARIVRHCREQFYPLSHHTPVRRPVKREIALQQRVEAERGRTAHQMGTAESIEFWREYLAQFQYIANFPDYWQLLEQVYGLIGGRGADERILDAGCGNGNFGMFLLINKAYRHLSQKPSEHRTRYVGLDFVEAALSRARRNFDMVADELRQKFPTALHTRASMDTSLVLADLNMALPFRADQFEGIVCNLVIGYVRDPLFVLRELLRVLAPNGKLVLTNLKPDADHTEIYRKFLPFARPDEELGEARRILTAGGQIEQAQRQGRFQSLDRQGLARLLKASGAVQPRIYSAFANQAFIAVAEKGGRQQTPPGA